MNNVLHLMVGPSGSGKSTFAYKLRNEDVFYRRIVSTDQIRQMICGDVKDQSKNKEVFFLTHYYTYRWLREGGEVILDATNYSKFSRETPIMLARLNKSKVIAYCFTTPIEECKRRNAARERQVPENILERQFKNFENPTLEEGIDEIIYV